MLSAATIVFSRGCLAGRVDELRRQSGIDSTRNPTGQTSTSYHCRARAPVQKIPRLRGDCSSKKCRQLLPRRSQTFVRRELQYRKVIAGGSQLKKSISQPKAAGPRAVRGSCALKHRHSSGLRRSPAGSFAPICSGPSSHLWGEMSPRHSLKTVKNEHVSSAAIIRSCFKDVDSRSRDEAPIVSRPAQCRDYAQNPRMAFPQHPQETPVEVHPHVASPGGIRVASVALEYFGVHYNIHHRLAFPRSPAKHSYLRSAKSPLQHRSLLRLRWRSVKTRSQREKPQAPVQYVARLAV